MDQCDVYVIDLTLKHFLSCSMGLLNIGSGTSKSESSVTLIIRRVTRSIALVAAVISLSMWCVYVYRLDTDGIENSPGLIVLFVLSPILLSVSWWENFVPQVCSFAFLTISYFISGQNIIGNA